MWFAYVHSGFRPRINVKRFVEICRKVAIISTPRLSTYRPLLSVLLKDEVQAAVVSYVFFLMYNPARRYYFFL